MGWRSSVISVMMLWSCWRPIPLSFSLPSAFSPTGCRRRHNCCQPNQGLLNNSTTPPHAHFATPHEQLQEPKKLSRRRRRRNSCKHQRKLSWGRRRSRSLGHLVACWSVLYFHGENEVPITSCWGYENVLQDQLWLPRPKMRFQECTARSIVVSTA